MPRKYALFFHQLSILERATDHECINNCNHPKEMWVGFKFNGLIIFLREEVLQNTTHAFPPSPTPPPPACLTSSPWFPHPFSPHPFSPQSPPPPSSVVVGRDISGSGAPAGVFSQKKGDPSNMTVALTCLMDQSRGRIRPERRR